MKREIYCTWTTCHQAKAPADRDCAKCSQRIEYLPGVISERKARAEKKGEVTDGSSN